MPFSPDEIIVHDELEPSYGSWKILANQNRQPAQAVWRSLQTAIIRLRSNAQWGEVVRQELIPRYFRERYGVSNLYCLVLAAFHRCFYTIANRAVIPLDIVDHPT
jgi:plasmid stabilization system protein ParE